MTSHSLALTRLTIAQSDRDAAQRRYDRAVARKDTKAISRALARLQEATERALQAEVDL